MKLLYATLDGIVIPEWLLDEAMCQPNKGDVSSDAIHDYVESTILSHVQDHPLGGTALKVSTCHVHISDRGLTTHDHLPHHLTSVLYLTDSDGELVIDPDGINETVKPKAGRMVIFAASTPHAVNESPTAELRIALVNNYVIAPV